MGAVASRESMDALLAEGIPRMPSDPASVLETIIGTVLPAALPLDHRRFLAFVPGPSNPIGALADMLASGFNLFGGTWLEAPGPIETELIALGWLRDSLGLPETTEGVFVGGGSIANLTALAIARDRVPNWREGVIYGSDQTHSSIWKACRLLGIGAAQHRVLPSDAHFRINLHALESALRDDAGHARPIIAIVGNAGTTNKGSVYPLRELATIARATRTWLHIDGACGAAAVLSAKRNPPLCIKERPRGCPAHRCCVRRAIRSCG